MQRHSFSFYLLSVLVASIIAIASGTPSCVCGQEQDAEVDTDFVSMEVDDVPCVYCHERDREFGELCDGCDLHTTPPQSHEKSAEYF